MIPTISVYNQATIPLGLDLAALIVAMQKYVDDALSPVWGCPAALTASSGPVAGAWGMVFLDTADVQGALAYHTDDGLPLAKVFVKTILDAGESVSVAATHELAEMLVDPGCNSWAMTPAGVLYTLEVCLGGGSEVLLRDGTRQTVGELAKRRLLSARRTHRSVRTVRVILTDGTSIQCTPDHRILLADGTYRRARALNSGDVLPCAALSDSVYGSEVYAVALGDNARRIGGSSNGNNVGFRQLGASMPISDHAAVSSQAPLRRSVQHILQMRAGEQMPGIDASADIAAVAHLKAIRNGTKSPLIGQAMSDQDSTAIANLAISGAGFGARPQPARIGLVDPRPKSIGQRGRFGIVCVPSRARSLDGSSPFHPRPVDDAKPFRPSGPLTVSDAAFGSGEGALPSPVTTAKALGSRLIRTSWDGAIRHVLIVDRVEEDCQTEVFDISVPERHNFALSNGAVVHNCDAVEETSFDVAGFACSDFCYPAWFGQPGTQYDHCHAVTAPFTLAHGGYSTTLQAGNMQQSFGSSDKADRFALEDRRGHRTEFRRTMLP